MGSAQLAERLRARQSASRGEREALATATSDHAQTTLLVWRPLDLDRGYCRSWPTWASRTTRVTRCFDVVSRDPRARLRSGGASPSGRLPESRAQLGSAAADPCEPGRANPAQGDRVCRGRRCAAWKRHRRHRSRTRRPAGGRCDRPTRWPAEDRGSSGNRLEGPVRFRDPHRPRRRQGAALGADAVLIGRPDLYGLALVGELVPTRDAGAARRARPNTRPGPATPARAASAQSRSPPPPTTPPGSPSVHRPDRIRRGRDRARPAGVRFELLDDREHRRRGHGRGPMAMRPGWPRLFGPSVRDHHQRNDRGHGSEGHHQPLPPGGRGGRRAEPAGREVSPGRRRRTRDGARNARARATGGSSRGCSATTPCAICPPPSSGSDARPGRPRPGGAPGPGPRQRASREALALPQASSSPTSKPLSPVARSKRWPRPMEQGRAGSRSTGRRRAGWT